MKKLKYQLYGEMYDEKIILQYEDIVIFNNYVDNMVTSISGELELKLNYGNTKICCPVIAKLIESSICFVPKSPECFGKGYEYIPIIISQESFKKLWILMRYDPYPDLNSITKITSDEILLMWLTSSNCRHSVDDLNQYLKYLDSKILSTSKMSNLFMNVIKNIFYNNSEKPSIKKTIIETTNTMEKVFVYLDKKTNYKWDAFRINKNMMYLYLGMNKCVPLLMA